MNTDKQSILMFHERTCWRISKISSNHILIMWDQCLKITLTVNTSKMPTFRRIIQICWCRWALLRRAALCRRAPCIQELQVQNLPLYMELTAALEVLPLTETMIVAKRPRCGCINLTAAKSVWSLWPPVAEICRSFYIFFAFSAIFINIIFLKIKTFLGKVKDQQQCNF